MVQNVPYNISDPKRSSIKLHSVFDTIFPCYRVSFNAPWYLSLITATMLTITAFPLTYLEKQARGFAMNINTTETTTLNSIVHRVVPIWTNGRYFHDSWLHDFSWLGTTKDYYSRPKSTKLSQKPKKTKKRKENDRESRAASTKAPLIFHYLTYSQQKSRQYQLFSQQYLHI